MVIHSLSQQSYINFNIFEIHLTVKIKIYYILKSSAFLKKNETTNLFIFDKLSSLIKTNNVHSYKEHMPQVTPLTLLH